MKLTGCVWVWAYVLDFGQQIGAYTYRTNKTITGFTRPEARTHSQMGHWSSRVTGLGHTMMCICEVSSKVSSLGNRRPLCNLSCRSARKEPWAF